jgi:putative multiple sugar transport system ATP-binding protein
VRDHGVTSIIISHKLNEIRAIADNVTIIRDGRTIETLSLGGEEVSEDRIIRGMVGRDMAHRYPERDHKPGPEVLRVEDWTVHHPLENSRVVVDHANLTVRAGEVVGIAGLMGAGRTELAMSIFGHSYGHNISGRVYLHGKEISARTPRQAIEQGIAYATEDRKTYGLNLIEDIKRNITAAALDKLSRWGWVDANHEQVVANDYRQSMRIKAPNVAVITGKLSGGNQQKVVLSKWMFANPDVLLLDEPTRGIDVGAKYEIYTLINQLASEGKAILVISSELPELLGTCDRIYAMSAGRITGEVPIEEANQEMLMQYMTKEKEEIYDISSL